MGSYGPGASAAPPGRVLPFPWPIDTSAAAKPAAASGGGPKHSAAWISSDCKTLVWQSGSELVLPYEWHQLLGQMRFSETFCLRASLEPLVLQRRLVGGLLVVSYADVLPTTCRRSFDAVSSAPFISPVTWAGGERREGPAGTKPEAAGPSVLARLKEWRRARKAPKAGTVPAGSVARAGAAGGRGGKVAGPSARWLRSAASVVAQAALGPHLPAVMRACTAAQALSTSPSLQEFAAVLARTVADALAAELYVNLAVRVAVVPPPSPSHASSHPHHPHNHHHAFLLPPFDPGYRPHHLQTRPASQCASGAALPQHADLASVSAVATITASNTPAPTAWNRALKSASSSALPINVPPSGRAAALVARTMSHREGSSSRRPSLGTFGAGSPVGSFWGTTGEERKAVPFALPSALLLHLLRHPNGHRPGNGSVHAGSVYAGSVHAGGSSHPRPQQSANEFSYHPDEPTVRGFVTQASNINAATATAANTPETFLDTNESITQAVQDLVFQSSGYNLAGSPSAHATHLLMAQRSGCLPTGGSGCASGGGAGPSGGTGGGGGGCGAGCVSGVVIANLNAWMQDLDKPSSDVALLLMRSNRAAPQQLPSPQGLGGGAGGATHGGPSQGGGMGGAAGAAAGPACMVLVAATAMQRGGGGGGGGGGTAAATAAAGAASRHGSHAEWVRNLEAPIRGGVPVDISVRGSAGCGGASYSTSFGSVYGGGGSVRYDGAGAGGLGCGPCVALYLTATERLPASLLRAVKERAQGLMEMLLPACLMSLTMGPVRADLEQLSTATCAACAATAAATTAAAAASNHLSSDNPSSPISGPNGIPPNRSRGSLLGPDPTAQVRGTTPQLQLQLQQLQAPRGKPPRSGSGPENNAPSLPTLGALMRLGLRAAVGGGGGGGGCLIGARGTAAGGPSVAGGVRRSGVEGAGLEAEIGLPKALLQLRFTAPAAASASPVSGEFGQGGGRGVMEVEAEQDSPHGLSGELSLFITKRWPGQAAPPLPSPPPPSPPAPPAPPALPPSLQLPPANDPRATCPVRVTHGCGVTVTTGPTSNSTTAKTITGEALASPGLSIVPEVFIDILPTGSGPEVAAPAGVDGDGCTGGDVVTASGTNALVTGGVCDVSGCISPVAGSLPPTESSHGGAGGGGDVVSSMRANLDLWVDSFRGMMREAPGGAGGGKPGSYADSDLLFLRLHNLLGAGGAAAVYAGNLLGMDVAVKVIHPPPDVDFLATAQGSLAAPTDPRVGSSMGPSDPEGGSEEEEGARLGALAASLRQAQMRELMRSARECAVLTSISHPAIVQVYSYHTRVQVTPGEGPQGLPRLVPVPPGEEGEGGEAAGPLHSVLIMERCDLGSLADALDGGLFKRAIVAAAHAAGAKSPTPPPAPAPQLAHHTPVSAGAAGGHLTANAAAHLKASGRSCHELLGPGGDGNGGVGGGFSFVSASPVPVSSPSSSRSGGGGSAMRAIYLTLLEVALALRHLHALNLVHCDIKVANVLLKSSASDPRGFTCKLSDFGLINMLRSEGGDEEEEGEEGDGEGQEGEQEDGPYGGGRGDPGSASRQGGLGRDLTPCMRNADAAGTVTHLAPECLTPGSRLDASVDVYAFGIVMWEVFTRKPPYAEFAPGFEDLPNLVKQGFRPRFPTYCPPAFKALAQSCWAGDPARRPTAAAIVTSLQQLLEGGAGGRA